ncbi:MAG: hypothetical protein AB7J40_04750 [Candidatus Altimarinota bacterium]
MDLKHQALHGMTKEALLSKLQNLKKTVEQSYELSDAALVELEVEDESLQGRIHEVEQQLHQLKVDVGSLQERMASQKRELSRWEKQGWLLEDYEAFLNGRFTLESAKFFTLSLADFAHQCGVGELSVEAALKQSTDAFSFVFQGKMYGFLKGLDGKYFFHGEEMSFLAF